MSNRLKGALPSILMALFGIIVLLIIPSQIQSFNHNNFLGPTFLPYLVACFIVILSLISVASSFIIHGRDAKEVKEEENTKTEKPNIFRSILIFVGLVLWILIVPIVGFAVTTILMIGAMMRILGNRSVYQNILVPVLFTAIIYYVFVVLLSVPVPGGLFF